MFLFVIECCAAFHAVWHVRVPVIGYSTAWADYGVIVILCVDDAELDSDAELLGNAIRVGIELVVLRADSEG